MSEKKTVEVEAAAENIPAIVRKNPELLPLWDWWVKEGRSTLLWVIIAAIIVGGVYGYRNWSKARNAAANQALVSAFATDELEAAAASYGSTKTGPAIKLRLAKSYYDAERYEDALAAYEGLAGTEPALADAVALGKAYALEGLKKYPEAQAAFAACVPAADAAATNTWFALTAKLGVARNVALAGDKAAAEKQLNALLDAEKDNEVAKMRVERLLDAVKRYDPARATKSLFDAANDAAKTIDAEKKDAKPAAAPAPVAQPAAKK